MKTVQAIYSGGTVGRPKNEPMWAVLQVTIKHGKGK